MIKRLSFAVLGCVFGVTSYAADVIDAPKINVRDSWKYNMTDGFTNDTLGTVIYRVVDITDKEVTTKTEVNTGAKSSNGLMYYDKSWNVIDNGIVKWTPAAIHLKFPVKIGDSWHSSFQSTNIKTGHSESCDSQTKAVGMEDITVPAGKLASLKIETVAECRSTEADGSVFLNSATYWYVAELNRAAKIIYSTTSNGRVRSKNGYELVEYSALKN